MANQNGGKIQGIFYERLEDFVKGDFKKGEFVIELLSQVRDKTFRDYVKFEVMDKFMSIMDNVGVGDTVIVDYSLSGRKWRPEGTDVDKFFTTLKAWDIKVIKKASGEQIPQDVNAIEDFAAVDDADLPF